MFLLIYFSQKKKKKKIQGGSSELIVHMANFPRCLKHFNNKNYKTASFLFTFYLSLKAPLSRLLPKP